MTKWHTLEIEETFRRLDTDAGGLSTTQARERLASLGRNKLPEERRRSGALIALDQVQDPIIYILLAAGLLSILLQDWVDAAVIFGVVALNGVIGFTQEVKAEAAIFALKKLLAAKAIALRDASEQQLDAEELVPGDIVLLQSGGKVPADIRLFHAKSLQVDQSMFTGESVPAAKTIDPIADPEKGLDQQANMAFMGSNIASGRGTGVVAETGTKTQLGSISAAVGKAPKTKTPLQERVKTLSRYILIVVLGFGSAGFVVGALRGENLVLLLLTLVALAVAAVPEGLPVAMTIALAVAVNRMAARKAIIRHLPAIETLGSCTVIGSDKTGTLTRNEMAVRRIWAGGSGYDVEGVGYDPEGRLKKDGEAVKAGDRPALEWTLRAGLLCNESYLLKDDGRWASVGDPTETALIVSARRAGLEESVERESHPQLDIVPFESELQYMATLNSYDDKPYLLVKGSPEKVLAHCCDRLDNEPAPLNKAAERDMAAELAGQGLRVLAMAYRPMPPGTEEITHSDVKDLTFLGLQGMLDPPRPEAIEAVAACRRSGIRVLMITGDNDLTGLSIARQMGIAGAKDQSLSGRDLDRLDDAELAAAVAKTPVFARVSPQHKLRIVQALIGNGEIVAVTGDGVNDAPALKAAHIGVAMGITGTDVAKEAADMVIVDDNFASLYGAIVNGRVAFDNLIKVTFFLLSSGLGILLAVMTNLFSTLFLIFLPAQILWVNLVTNGLQDVALAFEPKEPGVAERPPRPPKEGLLNRTLLIRLAIVGLIIGATSLAVFLFYVAAGHPEDRARTMALTTIVFAQFFNVLNSRSERLSVFEQNPLKNRFLLFSMAAALIAQLAFVYWPPLQFVFKTTPLTLGEWGIIIPLGLSVIAGGEFDKWRRRRNIK